MEALIHERKNASNIRNMDVQDIYEAFINTHKINSEKTAIEYSSRVKEFFELTLDKDIKFITLEDIDSIQNKDVKNKFVKILLDRGNKESTVLTKLRSVSSFYNELLMNGKKVNPKVLTVKLKSNVKHHQALTLDEYNQLLDFMKGEDDGLEKYLFTKMLFHTGGRKTASLFMRWDNICRLKDTTGERVWVITYIGKGKKEYEIPISDELYNEFTQLKEFGSEYVFPILSSSKGAYKRYERSLKKFGEVVGIKDLSIHNMKSTSLSIGYQMSRDINLCKQLGGHSNIETTMIYIGEEKTYTNQLSYQMSKTLDDSELKEMSHEDLLSFIDKHQDIKMSIMMRLNK